MDAMFERVSAGVATTNGSPGTQTSRWNLSAPADRNYGSTQPGAATVTMAWTLSAASGWIITAASFKAAATLPKLPRAPVIIPQALNRGMF